MEIGQKVKVVLTKGFVFTGIYSDDIPDSDNILIQGEKMGLIANKRDCVLVEPLGVPQANELLPHVSNSLLDLDGKTIPVTFHVSKFEPKIDIDLSNDC